jgi:hypothetical protein
MAGSWSKCGDPFLAAVVVVSDPSQDEISTEARRHSSCTVGSSKPGIQAKSGIYSINRAIEKRAPLARRVLPQGRRSFARKQCISRADCGRVRWIPSSVIARSVRRGTSIVRHASDSHWAWVSLTRPSGRRIGAGSRSRHRLDAVNGLGREGADRRRLGDGTSSMQSMVL